MNPSPTPSSSAFSRARTTFVEVVVFVAVLYFGKELFLPLALAILISFLLAPIVRRFERWHLRRVPAVLATTLIAFTIIAAIGYVMVGQLIDLANSLPKYQSNLHAKIVSLKTQGDSPWNRATRTLRQLSGEIDGTKPVTPAPGGNDEPSPRDSSVGGGGQPRMKNDDGAAGKGGKTDGGTAEPADKRQDAAPTLSNSALGKGTPEKPLFVEMARSPASPFDTLREFATPILGPLSMAAIVIVLVIFTLLDLEDIRERFIFLVGPGRLHVTTQALEEAGDRVSRYILAQATVNIIYGVPIGVGLWFIGVPNAVLWGLLAAVLRFIPYIGAWTAAAFPMALSLAIAPGWTSPLLTLGLFLVVELITNNAIEPWLYGSRTGLSTMAIIVSAVFWTWVWGPVGLILATPLTVCISVMGRYLPDFAFFELLLGDKPPIAVGDRYYQRLITLDAEGSAAICEEYATDHSLAVVFDTVIIPALRQTSSDRRTGAITESTMKEMHDLMRDVVEDLSDQKTISPAPKGDESSPILCLPASNESDELAALMLAELLRQGGAHCEMATAKSLASEMVETAVKLAPKLLCVSCVPPVSVRAGQYLCRRLNEALQGQTRIVAGLWGETATEAAKRVEKFKRVHVDDVFESLGAAAREILLQAGFAAPLPEKVETTAEQAKK